MAEILHQLIGSFSHYLLYRVSYIPGGAGFQPSTVWFHPVKRNIDTDVDAFIGGVDVRALPTVGRTGRVFKNGGGGHGVHAVHSANCMLVNATFTPSNIGIIIVDTDT